jgi:hypothetical protein
VEQEQIAEDTEMFADVQQSQQEILRSMTMTSILEITARWNSGEGKPYKGSLIDWDSYDGDGTEPPADIGCMCAQGQVLHLLGGWEPERLHDTEQSIADAETAKLLNISRAHAVLLRNINDSVDGAPSIVLTDPGKVLGDQWSSLLDFWWALDQFDAGQWQKVGAAGSAARDAAGSAAWGAARAAAGSAAGSAARDAAGDAAGSAARAAAGSAARDAAWEIQGSAILFDQSKPLFFLPMFGWSAPADIPSRPDDYGLGAVPKE